MWIVYLVSSANELRGGEAEDVCGREEEAAALLLEGPRVPRAAGRNMKYIRGVKAASQVVISSPIMFCFCLPGGLWGSRYSKVHGLVWKLHLCRLQKRLLPHPGTWAWSQTLSLYLQTRVFKGNSSHNLSSGCQASHCFHPRKGFKGFVSEWIMEDRERWGWGVAETSSNT